MSNGGRIEANNGDGIRLTLADEYSYINVYNLRGNQRTAGELARREGGMILGSASRNTAAIFVGIKDRAHTGPFEIFYRDIGDYLSREDKLRIVTLNSLESLDWQTIAPKSYGD